MLDVVNYLHLFSSEPQFCEIPTGFQKNIAQQETGARFLTCIHADELPLLRRVRIDHSEAIHIVKNDGEICIGHSGRTFEFRFNAQVTTWVSNLQAFAYRVTGMEGNG